MSTRTVNNQVLPIELEINSGDQANPIGAVAYTGVLLEIWEAVAEIAPFSFRLIDEIRDYIVDATEAGADWQEALDEQVVLKVLPRLNGTDLRLQQALAQIVEMTAHSYPLTHQRAKRMLNSFQQHGFSSYS